MSRITRDQALALVGRQIYAVRKDGTYVSGKLLGVSGDRLLLQRSQGKRVSTKAILPLVLFDVLAIGTAPYAYGPWGYGEWPGVWGGGWGWW